MMRHLTPEENEIIREMDDPNITLAQKNELRERLIQIDKEQNKNNPFCH